MITVNLDGVDLRPDQQSAAQQGALNPDKVFFQYICSTASGHDPDEEPDERVRDSHKALHGTVWRIDDPLAPIPPIGYGCRCAMRYVGEPGSVEAVVLGEPAPSKPTTVPDAYGEWLTAKLPSWHKYVDIAKEQARADRLGAVYNALKADGVTGDLREIARMIVSAGGARG